MNIDNLDQLTHIDRHRIKHQEGSHAWEVDQVETTHQFGEKVRIQEEDGSSFSMWIGNQVAPGRYQLHNQPPTASA
ncbi:MAG: hypothetical protein HQM04_12385 [Magnetococcales bacterium]|nr:hypothetical protein [Magnetococcales bacterium]